MYILVTVQTVHYLGEILGKRMDSSIGTAAVRYSEGPGFESRSACTFLYSSAILKWVQIKLGVYTITRREKCAVWPGHEPENLGIPYRGSID
jgi:hypothetical protein